MSFGARVIGELNGVLGVELALSPSYMHFGRLTILGLVEKIARGQPVARTGLRICFGGGRRDYASAKRNARLLKSPCSDGSGRPAYIISSPP